MEEKLIGIVINRTAFKENDVIVNVFTLEKGVVSASLKGVKKAGAKLKFASEPFCFAEFLFSERGGRRTVVGASLNDSFYPVRENIEKFYAATVVLEFIRKFARENIVSENLFFAVIDTLKNLAYGDKNAREILSGFLLTALKISGYALDLNGCFNCGKELTGRVFFDPFSGGFLCENCFDKSGREINYATYNALVNIRSGKAVTDGESKAALRLLDYYLTVRTEETLTALKELIK